MQRLAEYIVRARKPLIFVFVAMVVLAGLLIPRLHLTYDYESMLPEGTPSILGITAMRNDIQYGSSVTVVLKDVTNLREVTSFIDFAKGLDGYESSSWLEDVADPRVPDEIAPSTASDWVQRHAYRIELTFSTPDDQMEPTVVALRQRTGTGGIVLAASEITKSLQESSLGSTGLYFLIGALLVLIFLALYFPDPLTPLFMLVVMIGSVVVNLGTAALLGRTMFFISLTVVSVLQLAVTYDYGLFLYHRFSEEKAAQSPEQAMINALTRTFKAVALSALTTIAGFLALAFGHLALIKQMGWLLLQGVTISFVFTLVFLPAFLLTFDRVPRLRKFDLQAWLIRASSAVGRAVSRVPIIIVLIFFLLVPAAWFTHRQVVQTFNRQDYTPPNASFSIAQAEYEQYFGNRDTLYVVLDRASDHSRLLRQIEALPGVKQVLSPATMADAATPQELLPAEVLRRFTGSSYTLAIVTSAYGIDDPRNDRLKVDIVDLVKDLPGEHYVTGTSLITDDLKKAGQSDLDRTTWITIVLIVLLLFVGFRSLSLPALLVLAIEAAIWLNLSWYALIGSTVTFLVPIVLNSIQLGSTIDYSVLTATRLEEEVVQGKMAVIEHTVQTSLPSILVSAGTFILMALPTALLSNVPVIKQIMSSLVRGAAVSAVMVIIFVPALLYVLRKPVAWTSLGFKARKEQNS